MKLWRGSVTFSISAEIFANSEPTATQLLRSDFDRVLEVAHILANHYRLDCFDSPLKLTLITDDPIPQLDVADQTSEEKP